MSKNKNGDYDVGYGKPPRATRFQPGHSGNPSGRPKGSQNHRQLLQRIGKERVLVTERGKQRYLTRLQLAVKQFYNKALQGDMKALALLFQLQLPEEAAANMPDFVAEDQAVLASFMKQYGSAPIETPAPRSRKRKEKKS